jgi:ferritin
MGGASTTPHKVSIRQNFHVETENSLNDLVNLMFNVAYSLDSTCYFYERDDVAMFGMSKLFRHCRQKMLEGTRKLMNYICARGGKVDLEDINPPEKFEWDSTVQSLEALLNWKKSFQLALLKTHQVADKYNDAHLQEYLESEFMEPTLIFIRKTGVMLVNLQRAGTGFGEYQFDKHLNLNFSEILESANTIREQEEDFSSLNFLTMALEDMQPIDFSKLQSV